MDTHVQLLCLGRKTLIIIHMYSGYSQIFQVCLWQNAPSPSHGFSPHVFDCTRSVTCCSIALSSKPFSVTFFSFPKSIAKYISA